jgi:hypothetical protein
MTLKAIDCQLQASLSAHSGLMHDGHMEALRWRCARFAGRLGGWDASE